jgi:hypothetical protein
MLGQSRTGADNRLIGEEQALLVERAMISSPILTSRGAGIPLADME